MKRRLYYLLPDVEHARQMQQDLRDDHVAEESIHALTKNMIQIEGIRDVHTIQERDRDYFVEWFLWRLNLAVFFVALLAFIVMAYWLPGYWLILPGAVMLGTFLAGLLFVVRVPNVHWNEFHTAIEHGEVLVMVDVPIPRLAEINRKVHRRHPEAVTGGVGWHV